MVAEMRSDKTSAASDQISHKVIIQHLFQSQVRERRAGAFFVGFRQTLIVRGPDRLRLGTYHPMRQTIKKIYASVPLKRQAFEVLRRFYTPPEALYKHLHFKGDFSTSIDGKSFRMRHYGYEIENNVFWAGLRGGWERVTMSL